MLSYLGMQDVDELFGGSDQTVLTRERAHELWQMIEAPFRELHSILPFEALRNDRERARYLMEAPQTENKVLIAVSTMVYA